MPHPKKRFEVGDRVRMKAAFLRSTGQYAGGDAVSKWTVTACACGSCENGRLVATDELSIYGPEDGYPKGHMRHINTANLEKTRRRK